MKKLKSANPIKLTLCAGVMTLAALAPQVHAQSADALIDKLVEKGILTVNEASDLRDQADKDFKTAFAAKTGMPDWVTGYKLSGDVRGRFDQINGNNDLLRDRTRLRYRVRFGVAVNMMDNMEAGLRLASGDGNPLSSNSTMENNSSKKTITLDTAYGKWTILNSGGRLLAATVGKMDNPFAFTPMVFDSDLTPEGAALTGSYSFNDNQAIVFAGGAFVLDEEGVFGKSPGSSGASSSHDPYMYGGQITWNAKWTEKWSTSVGVGAFAIDNPAGLTDANVSRINQGNTRYTKNFSYSDSPYYGAGVGSITGLAYNYTPLIADASVTYTAASFPFYTGAFPIKFAGEIMHNPGAPKNNNGYWVGVTLGKSGAKKTWDLSYRYEYLEADAWYDQLVDDDNGAFYATPVYGTASGSAGNTGYAGWYGGTNVKGHLIKLNYSFTDSFMFSVSCFINDLITQPSQDQNSAYTVDLKSRAIHFMADVMWKF